MMPRTINKKSEGKHVGHACEGHLRGIVQRALKGTGLSLARELPFAFHVNPDVVILDHKGRVHTVIIVAYWNNADNSHMKYYRSRSEYSGIESAQKNHPKHFSNAPISSVILYGAPGGWKEQILSDLKAQCSPCFYLPDSLGKQAADELVAIAFITYKTHWESGKSSSREHVESTTAAKPTLGTAELKLLRLIKGLLARKIGEAGKSPEASTTGSINVRLPKQPISTRYRQPLGLLSVFPESEIAAWRASAGPSISSPILRDFALRAFFLGLGVISERRAVGRTVVTFQPANATRTVNGKIDYAPDLLDFKSWENIPDATRKKILDSHRELVRNPGSVFEGGAFDQCIGNWVATCTEIVKDAPLLIEALKQNDPTRLGTLLTQSKPVGPESWHPAAGQAQFFPTWALAVSILSCVKNDRALRSEFGARDQVAPTGKEALRLAQELTKLSDGIRLLEEAIVFCRAMLSRDLTAIISTKVPDLFEKENPSSLLKDFYNTLTTNSSHNPLNTPVRQWLEAKYPGYTWQGWPNKRSVSASDVLGVNIGRRQWQFIGISPDKKTVVSAEIKSITANNWGNKSKEIYDRIAETRSTAKLANVHIVCIGVLDGDIGKDEFTELATGIGYDEVYSIDEILNIS